ncbi:hypothetical protein Desku_3398 [Desulfofundulus kuznetsovii DSM 6115]|uniref:Uncharacterized protein n=1 Tax=Desulfofundulus kuznetsovii (strain DSM 6115 / VKM B-1805 / 17) TaxID=760568 RepID=A0AAU8PKW4_DESK7|nr:hypothetical protein Desku_3398 [Desulfofundulus kuznetsovii DSM 6115]
MPLDVDHLAIAVCITTCAGGPQKKFFCRVELFRPSSCLTNQVTEESPSRRGGILGGDVEYTFLGDSLVNEGAHCTRRNKTAALIAARTNQETGENGKGGMDGRKSPCQVRRLKTNQEENFLQGG